MQFQLALLSLLTAVAQAAIKTTPASAETVVQTLLRNEKYKSSVNNVKLTGHENCIALFTQGKSSVDRDDFPDEGVVLSTGSTTQMGLQTTQKDSTQLGNLPGDQQLETLVGGKTWDACILEFTFECTNLDNCDVSFDYIFGSDEYNSMVNNKWNDAFAWFLNGKNIALIPGTNKMVSIDTVNKNSYKEYFINNDPHDLKQQIPYPDFQADGFTVALTASGKGHVGTNTMRLVVADRGDAAYDSFALLGAKTLVIPPPKPPVNPAVGGDPHFRRWGQEHHDSFHGECDLVILHSERFQNNAGIDFHVRTTMRDERYSYVESAALKIGDDVLEIQNGYFLLNGAKYEDDLLPVEFGNDETYKYEVFDVDTRGNGSVSRRKYLLTLGETEIEFKFYRHIMSFEIRGNPNFENGVGMLGAFPTGEQVNRQGEIVENFYDFGMEWQVGHEDPILFADLRAPQLPYERCRLPAAATQSRRRLRGENTQLYEDAQQACAHVAGSDFQLCVDDVVMTGDLELAKEW